MPPTPCALTVAQRASLGATLLTALFVTPTARAQHRAGDGVLGAAFTVVLDSAAIAASPARTLADLLAGRVAGLNVTYPTGASGFAPELTARGAATVYGPGRPLLYVDGVLLREDRQLLGPDLDRNRPSHAWSLPTDEIAEIEIAFGPAAGALLAFGAPRGAVFVRTRRAASAADARGWRLTSSLEATHQPAPDEFRRRTFIAGDLTAGGTTDFCPLTDQATGYCTAAGPITRLPFAGRSPFLASTAVRAGLAASGDLRVASARLASVRLGSSFDQAPSQVRGGAFERFDLSLAAQGREWRGLRTALTARYARTAGRYARFGENGLMQLGLTTIQPNDTTYPFAWRTPERILDRSWPYHTDRVSAGVDLEWTARPWLTAYAQGNTERTTRGTDLTTELRNAFPPSDVVALQREERTYREGAGSATVGARMSGALPRGLRWRGEIGGHLSNVDLREYAITATASVGGGGTSFSQQWFNPDIRNRAVFAAARLEFGAHRWIAGGFRKEATEIFGATWGDDPFNTAQANWVVSEERFFPRIPGVQRVRLRGAYGESGDHEALLGAFQVAGFLAGGFGQLDRRLQRTIEREAGADIDLVGGRAQVRLNAFARSLRDGYMITGGGPPLSFASWQTHGHEWVVALPARTAGAIRWDAELAWSSARTRITRMVTPEVQSTLLGGQRVRFSEGMRFGTVHAVPYTWADANDDGIVDATEIVLGAATPRGVTQPSDLLAVTLKASWRERLTAGLTLDGKFGHVKSDATGRFSCQLLLCPDLYEGSLAEQARAVASGYTANFTGPVHAADFVRAREIWVRAALPSRVGPLSLGEASLTLAVRNAGIWSRYPGGDPETGSFAFATVQRGDYLTPALLRQVTLRLDLVP